MNFLDPRLPERFWSKCIPEPNSGCWLWLAMKRPKGYGMWSIGHETVTAHHVTYELAIGPIPHGLQIDHLCRVHCCVNPAHLEAVTSLINNGRRSADVLTCKRGHSLADAYVHNGHRNCRQCKREHTKRWNDRRGKARSAARPPDSALSTATKDQP